MRDVLHRRPGLWEGPFSPLPRRTLQQRRFCARASSQICALSGAFRLTNREWIDRFLQYLRLEKGVAENTIASYRYDLQMYETHLKSMDLLQVQPPNVSKFLKFLYARKLKPRSATRAFAAVRGLHK